MKEKVWTKFAIILLLIIPFYIQYDLERYIYQQKEQYCIDIKRKKYTPALYYYCKFIFKKNEVRNLNQFYIKNGKCIKKYYSSNETKDLYFIYCYLSDSSE
ncbi:hypothetical protein [Aureibacter tunicatorum]|uniref:Transmembrane protein n=1 Tax=Aureibacter tunicatorum TaxID=866807 RepID=A0AAE3XLV7_9BACT|nr:hypothetical protein [Aureibacter tunicatorum]MDR6239312.1 hypothetical protein [Aureibacter tunicatorum]BDD04764.1 hypothetical protein AUTU_22470 [Aureibacter tunicatorum]